MHAKSDRTPVKPSQKSAEGRYREAFERLKQGAPTTLPIGTPVSQNNVAKEAGCDPTALRKSRFTSLIAEIQRWVKEHDGEPPPSQRQKILAQRARNRTLKEQLEALKIQHNLAISVQLEADSTILNQAQRIADLESKLKELKPSAKVILHPGGSSPKS
jgi:hypothetical protein